MCTKPDKFVPPEERLKRFLYLSNDSRSFVTGDAEAHGYLEMDKVGFVEELLTSHNPERLVNIVEIANGENTVPCRSTLFFVLAAAACSKAPSASLKNKIYTAALHIPKNDAEFFRFVKYIKKLDKSFSSGINKIVARYYMNKEPTQLVFDVSSRKGYHGWTHKDLIKLSHIKTDEILHQIVITYILWGMEKARSMANENTEAIELLDFLKKSEELKKSTDEDFVIAHLKELKFGFEQVPSALSKSPKIWEYLLEGITIPELLTSLPRLYKQGLLKLDSVCQTKVVEILSDSDRIKDSGVHPLEVFIALRNFEKGGRPRDPKLIKYLEEKEGCELKAKSDPEYKKPDFAHVEPTKCPNVVSALNKALMLSYQNVQVTGKRYMLTLDLNEAMDKPCITSKNLTCLEAAVVLTLSYLKAEKNVTVAVFNGMNVSPVALDKGGSVSQAIKKLRDVEHEVVFPGAPMAWAMTKKKPIDVFLNLQSVQPCMRWDKPLVNPTENLSKYKVAMNMFVPKLVICHLRDVFRTDYGESVLDVRGVDVNLPKIINAFVKNLI